MILRELRHDFGEVGLYLALCMENIDYKSILIDCWYSRTVSSERGRESSVWLGVPAKSKPPQSGEMPSETKQSLLSEIQLSRSLSQSNSAECVSLNS